MKISKPRNKRPKSCHMKNITINKNINRHIPIISSRIFSSKNIPKTPLPQNNKQHIPNSSIYLDRFKSQLKKFDMYKEMWDKSKSFSEEDMLGIAQTIQINSENIQNNFRANATSTRKNSAMTFNDLSYKSKRRVKKIKTNNNYNLGQMDREKSNYLNMKTNTKNKLRTNIFFDLFHDKESTINMSNYNSTLQTNNKNFLSTELNQLHNLIEANKSNNNSKKQEYFNYGVPKKDFNKKEIVIINENKKTIEENDDKNNLEKLVRENSSSTLNLRTDYLIRFSKLLGLAKKFIYSMDFFRIEKRDIFSLYMKNLTEAFDSCNDFFINQIKEGDILDNNTWSIILSQYYNLSFHVIKFQNYAFKEMQFLKNENLSFKQKLYSVEGELNIKKKDINDINKYILQYDLVNKVKYKKKREMTIKEIVNNFKEVSEKLKNLKEEFEENKNDFDNQNSQKNVTIKVLSHANIDLNEKINELEAEIQKYKEKEEDTKRQFIEYEAKLKNLNDIIHQKNILIEELKAEKIIIKEKSTDENKVLPELEATFLSPQGNLRKKYNKKYQPSTDT